MKRTLKLSPAPFLSNTGERVLLALDRRGFLVRQVFVSTSRERREGTTSELANVLERSIGRARIWKRGIREAPWNVSGCDGTLIAISGEGRILGEVQYRRGTRAAARRALQPLLDEDAVFQKMMGPYAERVA